MPDSFTPNLNLDQPSVGGDNDVWGTTLNDDLAIIDAQFAASGTGTVIRRDNVNRGSAIGFVIEQPAGNSRTLDYQSGTALRWQVGADSTAEGGSNAGSDLFILRYADDGTTLLGTSLNIERETGQVTFETTPEVGSNQVWHDGNGPTNVLDAINNGQLPTGAISFFMGTAAPTGWLIYADQTIGNTLSSAAYANANAQSLYALIWNDFSQSEAPVTGGRGASAAADWAGQKAIQLPPLMGSVPGVAGNGTGLSVRTLGQRVGEETHTLSAAEQASMPNAGITLSNPGATAQANITNAGNLNGGNTAFQLSGVSAANQPLNTENLVISTNVSVGKQGSAQGGGGSHNNMQPTTFLNVIIKL